MSRCYAGFCFEDAGKVIDIGIADIQSNGTD